MRFCHFREDLAGSDGALELLFSRLENSGAASAHALHRGKSALASARFDRVQQDRGSYLELLRLGDDLSAVIVNAHYPDRITMPVAGEDFIEFHFRLSGSLSLMKGADTLEVSQGNLLLWRQPRGRRIIECLHGDGNRESSVTIYCRPSFIERCFGPVEAILEPSMARAFAPVCEQIVAMQAVLYPTLTRLVLDLASGADRSRFGLVRAEALAIQIVAEVLANASFQRRTQIGNARLSDRDVACLNKARETLSTTFTPAPTIEKLARQVGLSPTKLKFGFRFLFGQTVSEYVNELRMNAARDLLRKSKPISHVSAELGYDYQNSFTVAFRRHYGVLPKDYRRNPLDYDHLIMLKARVAPDEGNLAPQ